MGMIRLGVTSALAAALLAGCGPETGPLDDEFEGAAELEPGPATGKADGYGVKGPAVLPDDVDTRVWVVKNQWEDTDTPAAREAGMAWEANSGLNWDQKYSRWIESLQPIPIHGSTSDRKTYMLTTPWGKTIPAASVDCADQTILLRASFAAWYNLPFYFEAYDWAIRERVFYSHAGIRTPRGRWNNTPRFRVQYKDYSDWTKEQLAQRGWPQDAGLRRLGVIAKDDQPFISETARTGAYLDEIHLNKRAARFIRLLLIYTGTPNLADGRNTFNLIPEAVRVGDTLLYRRARKGSGHTMVVLRRETRPDGKIAVEIASGNDPPRQPPWQDQGASKRSFTSNEGGGPTQNSLGETYSHLGGGLKRFRVAKLEGGFWKNTFMSSDTGLWIDDSDYEAIGARPKQFEEILGEPTPEEKRVVLLQAIEDARERLRMYPASCAARIEREKAFNELYWLEYISFQREEEDVDALYRIKEDYVFAELDYEQSRTCCWNSSTSQMFQLIMAYVELLEQNSTECKPPPVFKVTDGGFGEFAQYAASVGQGSVWVPWSADETCPQAEVQNDTEKWHRWTDYCALNLWSGTPPPEPQPAPEPTPEPTPDPSGEEDF